MLDHLGDEVGDRVPDGRAHRADERAGAEHLAGQLVGCPGSLRDLLRLLGRGAPIGGAGLALPAGQRVGAVRALLGGGAQLLGDVLPGLGVRLDRARIAGQHVQRFTQEADVLDDPADTGGQSGLERVFHKPEVADRGGRAVERALLQRARLLEIAEVRDDPGALELARTIVFDHELFGGHRHRTTPLPVRMTQRVRSTATRSWRIRKTRAHDRLRPRRRYAVSQSTAAVLS